MSKHIDAPASSLGPSVPAFSYDANDIQRDKNKRAYLLHVVQIPQIRIIGFSLMTLVTLFYDLSLATPFPMQGFLFMAGFNLAYTLASFVLTRLLYARVDGPKLTLLFLHLDFIAWLVVLHHVNGAPLLFAVFLLVRVGDQIGFGFRRALYFNHVVVATYLAYVAWLTLSQQQVAPLSEYLTIAVTMYFIGVYLSLAGIAIETLRKRTGTAVRQARELLMRLDGKTRELNAQAMELDHARRQAESANRAKSDFLASMSHELRTPLNAILGYAQLMEMREDIPRDIISHAREIKQAGDHLLALVNDILDLARIESGHVELQIETFAPAEILAACRTQNIRMAEARKISLSCNANGTTHHVVADRRRLLQVLNNLISNAIKYNRDNGQVSVSCQDGAMGRIRFAVTDTGPGISADKQALLFQPFNRLGAERGPIEGTGIGLVITRELVEQMGGVMGLDSQEGHGSTFWAELPAALAAQGTPIS